jgi:UPF0271 protein
MSNKKILFYILDTSAILSGKSINLKNAKIVTIPDIESELKPGGKDYQIFLFLKQKGLIYQTPSKKAINKITNKSKETGDFERLSNVDIQILALSLDIKNQGNECIILTDDYSIQNIANYLDIKFETISQRGITQRFKWMTRCQGCGKKFKDNISICPICGAETKKIVVKKQEI